MDLHPDVERLALLGWRLHPASRYSRAACIKNAADLATRDLAQLARWSREFPDCCWRVVMEGSGIWALDVDVPGEDHKADGVAALVSLVAMHGPIPPRPTTRSGGGGCALFFRHSGEPISGKTGTPVAGLDPRRGRLAIALPPSVHPSHAAAVSLDRGTLGAFPAGRSCVASAACGTTTGTGVARPTTSHS